jgi:hypothetical protein
MLEELGKSEWLAMLDLCPEEVPAVLVLRGTRNLQAQYEIARSTARSTCLRSAP